MEKHACLWVFLLCVCVYVWVHVSAYMCECMCVVPAHQQASMLQKPAPSSCWFHFLLTGPAKTVPYHASLWLSLGIKMVQAWAILWFHTRHFGSPLFCLEGHELEKSLRKSERFYEYCSLLVLESQLCLWAESHGKEHRKENEWTWGSENHLFCRWEELTGPLGVPHFYWAPNVLPFMTPAFLPHWALW